MRSEDPSQLIGMDISPSSPWKTPIKIDPDVAGKNDNDAADELQNLSISDYKKLQAKIAQLELENKAIVKAQIVSPVTGASGSGRKPNYTHTHPTRHVAVKETAEPVLSELKKKTNNPDAIWWVAKHVEALSAAAEKPDWHASYKLWAKDEKVDAIDAFMGSVQGV